MIDMPDIIYAGIDQYAHEYCSMNYWADDFCGEEVKYISEAKHKAEIEALQAKIDALMLEHCHDEMTEDQCAEYERNQRAVKLDISAED